MRNPPTMIAKSKINIFCIQPPKEKQLNFILEANLLLILSIKNSESLLVNRLWTIGKPKYFSSKKVCRILVVATIDSILTSYGDSWEEISRFWNINFQPQHICKICQNLFHHNSQRSRSLSKQKNIIHKK